MEARFCQATGLVTGWHGYCPIGLLRASHVQARDYEVLVVIYGAAGVLVMKNAIRGMSCSIGRLLLPAQLLSTWLCSRLR